jgi:hypothetical protein
MTSENHKCPAAAAGHSWFSDCLSSSDREFDADARGGGGEFVAAALEDAASFAFAAGAPHAVVDAGIEGVFEARGRDGAIATDLAGAVNANAVAREERGRRMEAAVAVSHPRSLGIGVVGGSVELGRPFVQRGAISTAETGRPWTFSGCGVPVSLDHDGPLWESRRIDAIPTWVF